MERLPTRLDGPLLLAPKVFGDARGFFAETYRESTLRGLGITETFVQDNHSRSRQGVVRGMHFSLSPKGAAKLVRCGRGRILDVVADLRRDSPTFGEWEAFELSDDNMHVVYVPPTFAHGFVVLSEIADVLYKQSDYYDPAYEKEFSYKDPDVGIEWPPDVRLEVSQRDEDAPPLRDIKDALPF